MPEREPSHDRPSRLRLEPFEPRLLMSAAPVWTPSLDDFLAAAAATAAAQPGTAGSSTPFDQIRSEYGFTGVGQTVVVIDSGVDYKHEALGGGLGAGFHVVGGWDFAENDADPADNGPAGGHGTHVNGIIASIDPAHLGAVPGVDLVDLRVFDDHGTGSFAWIDQALAWVHQHRNDFAYKVTTVNLSIGSNWNAEGVPPWATLESDFAQLKADGIFISVAAGNSFSQYKTVGLSYPAASSYVVPVASVDADGSLSYFSQRDSRVIAAPGRNIVSSVPDYLGNFNGKEDDFAAFSGTSMAAPYVAGASVLLRQAFDFVGVHSVTEDMLYNAMRNTADSVYDPATGQSYKRLNVQRAIDSIMPSDDAWSTAASALRLGTMVDTASVSGTIARLSTRDYVTFTAGQTGIATFTADTTGGLVPRWQLVGGQAASTLGKSFSFSVVAGQTYTLDLGAGEGIGRYQVAGTIKGAYVDWGAVDLKSVHDQAVGPATDGFTFRASRDGLMTVEATFDNAAGNVDLDLYDMAGRLLGSSHGSSNSERIDVQAAAGQTFVLRAHGTNAHVDFRLTNLVSISGSTVSVHGTATDDTLVFVAGPTRRLVIDGVAYQFDAAAATTFDFQGSGGHDAVTLTGAAGTNLATLTVGGVDLSGQGYRFSAQGVASITVHAAGTTDRAIFYDSAGDDTFVASPLSARMDGSGFENVALGFDDVQAFGGHGDDRAFLFDSPGNDTLVARPNSAQFSGSGFRNTVSGFTQIYAYSTQGTDQATLFGAADGGTFVARLNQGIAYFRDGNQIDSTTGFARVLAVAGAKGNAAQLYGSAGNDTLTAKPDSTQLAGNGFNVLAQGFGTVWAYGGGGFDQANLYDSTGNDTLTAFPTQVELSGTGFDNHAIGFQQVRAFSSGGHDRASLYDSDGDDTVILRAGYTRLYGTGFDNSAYGFAQSQAFSRLGHDTAKVYTSLADQLFAAAGRGVELAGATYDELLFGFANVWAYATDGAPATVRINAVDFVFAQVGAWGSSTVVKSAG